MSGNEVVHEDLRRYLDDLWRWKCGLPPRDPGFEAFVAAQWSPTFEKCMRRRLVFGAYRYGTLGAKGKKKYDLIAAMKKRIEDYEKTGNLELMVDVANFCLLEFVEGEHPLRHFLAVDDAEHVEVKTNVEGLG